MTTSDWSKAPEGATHWGPETEGYLECWYKFSDDGWRIINPRDNRGWLKSFVIRDDLVPRPHAEDEITPATGIDNRSDGSTASYYQLPDGATDLQHLISHRDMNAQIGEVFRACYRYGMASHSDQLRDAKKILFYAQAEVERLERYGTAAK